MCISEKTKTRRRLEFKFKKGKQDIIPQEIKEMLASLKRFFVIDYFLYKQWHNHVSSVIVSVLSFFVLDCGVDPWLNQTKEHKIGMCCMVLHWACRIMK